MFMKTQKLLLIIFEVLTHDLKRDSEHFYEKNPNSFQITDLAVRNVSFGQFVVSRYCLFRCKENIV